MKAVVDASVIIRGIVPGSDSHAESRQWLAAATELLAPHLLWFEVTTGLRYLEFFKTIPEGSAELYLQSALRLNVRLETPPGLYVESVRLAQQLAVSRTRDTSYLALALLEKCPVVTLDIRFQRNAASHGFEVMVPGSIRDA